MKSIFKKVSLLSLGFLAAIAITACNDKKTTKTKSTTKTATKVKTTSSSTTKKGHVTTNPHDQDSYFITVNNTFSDLELEISYLDLDANTHEITDFTKTYPAGIFVCVEFDNMYTTKMFEISAIMGGRIVRSEQVDKNDIGNLTTFQLTGNVTIKVEEISGIVQKDTVRIFDGRDLDDELKNVVKVYDADGVVYEDGDEVAIGKTLYLEVYNYASNATLNFYNDSEEDENIPKEFDKISTGKYGPYSFVVAGQIYIDLEGSSDELSWTVLYDDDKEGVVITVTRYDEQSGQNVEVENGTKVDDSTKINVTIVNNSSSTWTINIYLNGAVDRETTVGPNATGTISNYEVGEDIDIKIEA